LGELGHGWSHTVLTVPPSLSTAREQSQVRRTHKLPYYSDLKFSFVGGARAWLGRLLDVGLDVGTARASSQAGAVCRRCEVQGGRGSGSEGGGCDCPSVQLTASHATSRQRTHHPGWAFPPQTTKVPNHSRKHTVLTVLSHTVLSHTVLTVPPSLPLHCTRAIPSTTSP
jgi:hypothetical protein